MSKVFQVTIDARDPESLGVFWAEALGYVREAPPAGFDSWPDALTSWGLPPERHNDANAIVDPDGSRPRVFLQKVPEAKTVKNRVHLDVRVSGTSGPAEGKGEALKVEADRLVGLGATLVRETVTQVDHFLVMQDPEGNEFCLT
ncbi:MAG: VOC family protein [Terracoccus sp.]